MSEAKNQHTDKRGIETYNHNQRAPDFNTKIEEFKMQFETLTLYGRSVQHGAKVEK